MPQSATHASEHLVIRIAHQFTCAAACGEIVRFFCRIIRLVAVGFKVAHPSHLGDDVIDVLHGHDLLLTLYNPVVKHLRDAVFDVANDLVAVCCIPEVLLHLDHIGTQHVISILFDVKNDAVYVNDDGPVHFLVVLYFCLFAVCLFGFACLRSAYLSWVSLPGCSLSISRGLLAVDVCTAKTSSSHVTSNLLSTSVPADVIW